MDIVYHLPIFLTFRKTDYTWCTSRNFSFDKKIFTILSTRRAPLWRSCDFSAITRCRIASKPSSLNSPRKTTWHMLNSTKVNSWKRNGGLAGWKNPESCRRVKLVSSKNFRKLEKSEVSVRQSFIWNSVIALEKNCTSPGGWFFSIRQLFSLSGRQL